MRLRGKIAQGLEQEIKWDEWERGNEQQKEFAMVLSENIPNFLAQVEQNGDQRAKMAYQIEDHLAFVVFYAEEHFGKF